MKFALALLALVPALALAAPVEKRQGGESVTCGNNYYSASQVNQAINNAENGDGGSSDYPHQYHDYEGIDFSEYCPNTSYFEEYPLSQSYNGYTGGSPGADRVVYDGNSGNFCGAITHTGASGNNFVQCDYQ